MHAVLSKYTQGDAIMCSRKKPSKLEGKKMSVALLKDHIRQSCDSSSPTKPAKESGVLKLSDREVSKINEYKERNSGADEFPLLWDEEKK